LILTFNLLLSQEENRKERKFIFQANAEE